MIRFDTLMASYLPIRNAHRKSDPERTAVRAWVFDVDGTLYSPTLVRSYILLRLCGHVLRHPTRGLRELRLLKNYREAQEYMRTADVPPEQQLHLACSEIAFDAGAAQLCIDRWMNSEPLAILRHALRPGVRSLLEKARKQGIKLGVVSDYPAVDKLRAMGILELFDALVSAQHPEVGTFKPSPKGLLLAARLLSVPPTETIYIGDRPEVDAEAARRAGMPSVIVGRSSPGDNSFRTVANFHALAALLLGEMNCSGTETIQ